MGIQGLVLVDLIVIFLIEPRNKALLCGHQLCWDCAQKVDHCPFCGIFITNRIRLLSLLCCLCTGLWTLCVCCYCACVKMMGLIFLSFVKLEGINKVMMADRPSDIDRLVNKGQLSWTLIQYYMFVLMS